jgi:hypothetical protein
VASSDFRRQLHFRSGTTEAPHFDRAGVQSRIASYATLAADGLTANLALTPDEQEFKCQLAPEAFVPVDNALGPQGLDHNDAGQRSARPS